MGIKKSSKLSRGPEPLCLSFALDWGVQNADKVAGLYFKRRKLVLIGRSLKEA